MYLYALRPPPPAAGLSMDGEWKGRGWDPRRVISPSMDRPFKVSRTGYKTSWSGSCSCAGLVRPLGPGTLPRPGAESGEAAAFGFGLTNTMQHSAAQLGLKSLYTTPHWVYKK